MTSSILNRLITVFLVLAFAGSADVRGAKRGEKGESGKRSGSRSAETGRRSPKPLEARPSGPKPLEARRPSRAASKTAEARASEASSRETRPKSSKADSPARDARVSVGEARTSAKSRLERVRQNRQETKRQLPGPSFRESRFNRPRIISSFERGRSTNRQLEQDEIYYRYWGTKVEKEKTNKQPEKVSWLVKKRYDSEQAFRDDVAVSNKTRIERVTTYRVPKGTWVTEGKAADSEGHPGGGYQAVIGNVARAWKVTEERPFPARKEKGL